MAFNYDSAPNGIFIQIGKIAKEYNDQRTEANTIDASITAIVAVFEAMTAGAPELMIEGFPTEGAAWVEQHVGRRANLTDLATTRFQDKVTVLDELILPTTSISSVMVALINDMIANSETVEESTVTLGSLTTGAANIGDGTVLFTKIMDGVTSPSTPPRGVIAANLNYNGVNSEIANNETQVLIVKADSYVSGVTEGSESLSRRGLIADGIDGVSTDGSGTLTDVTVAHSATVNRLVNPDFETWTVTDTPDNWTITAGAASTNVFEETNLTNVYHGLSSCQFLGDGVATEVEIQQGFTASLIKAQKMYCVTCRLKGDASITLGDLTLIMKGTGYTAASTEKVVVLAAAIPTVFTLQSFFVIMPQEIPSDFVFSAEWSGTPTSGKNIWIDDFSMSEVQYGGGVGLVVVRGSTPFVLNDRFDLAVANDNTGKFQRFFLEAFNVQLPSSGTPSISDGLVA